MALALSLEITAETRQAEQGLERVERGLGTIAEQAAAADKRLDAGFKKLDQNLKQIEDSQKKAESATKKAVGQQDALTAAVARYVGPAAIGAAIASTVHYAGKITDLAARTGMSIEAVQKLGNTAENVGVSIDQISQSIGMLSNRLASGDKSALAALKQLGLSFDQIRNASPDQAFLRIASAVGDISDPMKRAQMAMDLFGRSGLTLLPALNKEFVAATKNASAMSAETAKRLDEVEDSFMDVFRAGRVLLAEVLSPMVPVVTAIAAAFRDAARAMQDYSRNTPGGMGGAATAGVLSGGIISPALYQRLMPSAGSANAAQAFLSSQLFGGVMNDEAYGWFYGAGRPTTGPGALATGSPLALAQGLGLTPNELNAAISDLTQQAKQTATDVKKAGKSHDQLAIAAARLAAVEAAFSASIASIQRLPVGTAPSLFGSGNTIGSMVPTFAGGVFSPAGTLGRAGNPQNPFGGLFGGGLIGLPAQAVLSGSLPAFNQWGGSSQITSAMGAPGTSYSHLMGPGLNWQGAGIAGLNAAMPFLAQALAGGSRGAQMGGSIGGAGGGIFDALTKGAGGLLGSLSGFLGPIGGLVGGLIGRLFGPSQGAILGQQADARIGQTQAGLLQQFGSVENIAGMGPAGAALAAAWGSKNVEGEKWFNQLNSLLQEQLSLQEQIKSVEEQRQALIESLVPTYDEVVKAAERYGISIEGLGPQIAQLGANTTWKQMLEDIELLARAGGDMGGILVGMKDEIGKMVDESRRIGTEIPANMRPYIENLVETGQLLDANGQAITDLEGIKWGPAIETQADAVNKAIESLNKTLTDLTTALENLFDKLSNDLPAAAQAGARGANDALSSIEPPDIRYGSGGSQGESVEGFASGSGGIRDFGTGTLAVLHGREAVLTEKQLRGLTSRQPTVIRTTVVLDGRVLAESTSAYQAAAAGLVR